MKKSVAPLTTDAQTLITIEQSEAHTGEDIEKCQIKAQLEGNKLRLESDIQSQQRRLKLLGMSLEYEIVFSLQ